MIPALRILVRLSLSLTFFALIYVAATYTPLRVIAPTLAPVTCVSELICIDDTRRSEMAIDLYQEALSFVNSKVDQIQNPPRAYFCSTDKCSDYFGLGKVAGYATSKYGIVIKPNGWKNYIVRHELIHHLQAEHLGDVGLFLRPEWFREGMAYSLSEDPRRPLPSGLGLETLRSTFEDWYAGIDPNKIWIESRKLSRN